MDAITRGVCALEDFVKRTGREPSKESDSQHERFVAHIADLVALLASPEIEVPPAAVERLETMVRGYEARELDRENGL